MLNAEEPLSNSSDPDPSSSGFASLRLKCPTCRGPLLASKASLHCAEITCGAIFPVIDDIPILIDERHSVFRHEGFAAGRAAPSTKSKWKTAMFRWMPGLDLNLSGATNISGLKALLLNRNTRPVVLNIGGKHPDSTTASLSSHATIQCIECDLVIRPRTNLIADPAHLPLEDESVDAVIIDAMLEHVLDPNDVVEEARRVLKHGGFIYADTPFMLQVHGGAMDFVRFTHLGHRRVFRSFEEISSGITGGPGVALSYSILYFCLSFAQSAYVRFGITVACRLLLFWIKYFDHFLVHGPGAIDAAHGVYFLGRKSGQILSDEALIASYIGCTKVFYPLILQPIAAAAVKGNAGDQ